jgi:hypothetical protein
MTESTIESARRSGSEDEIQTSEAIAIEVLDEGATATETIRATPGLVGILARASAINNGRNSFDLSFSSLLVGFSTGTDPICRWLTNYFVSEGVDLHRIYERVGADAILVEERARSAMVEPTARLGSPQRRTQSARRAMLEAAEIAAAQSSSDAIDAVHLIAALLSLTDYHEEDFGRLGIDRARWGAALLRHIAASGDSTDAVDFWKRFYERRFPGHPLPDLSVAARRQHRPDYDPDAYTSQDLLEIEDEVRALAYVVASVKAAPPLAIGLFGEWGSGKTFFMKHLRRRIEKLSAGARAQEPKSRACHGYIAQIEFNAWHYQEGDLWASLVDHILRNLRFGEKEDEAKLAERSSMLIRQIERSEAREKVATAEMASAESRAQIADARLSELVADEARRRTELERELGPAQILAAVREHVTVDPDLSEKSRKVLQSVGVDQVGTSAAELQGALVEARQEIVGVGALLTPLLRAKDRHWRVVLLVAVLLIPMVLGLAIDMLLSVDGREWLGKLAGATVGLASLSSGATRWLRRQTNWTRELRGKIEPLARALDRQIQDHVDAGLSEHRRQVAAQRAQLEAVQQQQTLAQREKEQALTEAAGLRLGLAAISDDWVLRSFLDERIRDGVYQKRLGIAALVRRDFERLSNHIQDLTDREATGMLRKDELVVNRIVLYIDDLDRCDDKKVVDVLRAVHLLLAFPAFVVVVGVDSRWVAQCLDRYLANVLGNSDADLHRPAMPARRVTALDYLEKIFQIPVWLESIPPARRAKMARALLRPGPAVSIPIALPAAGRVVSKPAIPAASRPASMAGKGEHESASTAQTAAEQTREEIDLNPEGLDITERESEFLERLAPLLSPSPRVLKRFVNTYRLINVGINQRDAAPVAQPHDSALRMFLLAIFVARPNLSWALQDALRDMSKAEMGQALSERMRGYLTDEYSRLAKQREWDPRPELAMFRQAEAEWQEVETWLGDQSGPWLEATAARFQQWLEPVSRYTFNLTRVARRLEIPSAKDVVPMGDATEVPVSN